MAEYSIDNSRAGAKNATKALFAKIFGYMSLFLLITFITSFGVSLLFQYGFDMYYDAAADTIHGGETAATIYLGVLIGSSILQLILTIIITFVAFRRGKGLAIPAFLYSVCMGVLISSFGMLMPWYYIVGAFGITFLSFAGMAIIGLTSKRNLSGLGFIGYGILFSIMIVSLFSIIFYLIFPGFFEWMYVGISVLIIVAMLLITAFDIWNIKKIIEKGQMSNNLALYCAFNLYVDFIVIFIRILSLLAHTRN